MIALRLAFSDPTQASARALYFDAHRQYLRSTPLRILLSGPFLSETGLPLGALIVAEVASLQELQDFSAADPFVRHAVYGEVKILTWSLSLSALAGLPIS
jgi:uncharacterized protein YciI